MKYGIIREYQNRSSWLKVDQGFLFWTDLAKAEEVCALLNKHADSCRYFVRQHK